MKLAPSDPANQVDPIPGILTYGSLNLLAGASGVGKTCLLSWLLTRLRDGLDVFGRPVNAPTKIGFVCADRGAVTAEYWMDKAGYPDLPLYSLADDPQFLPPRLRSRTLLTTILGECLDKLRLPPGSLAVVDPISLFLGGNLMDYQSCAVACIEIRRLCRARHLTLIGTAHASKQKSDKKEQYRRLQDRILGSAAQLGYGDTQMYLASPEETGEAFYSFLWHSHTSPPAVFPLGRNAEGLFIPWAESIEAAEEGNILANIPEDGTPVSYQLLLQLTGVSRATLFRKLNDLIDAGILERAPDQAGWYQRRPPTV